MLHHKIHTSSILLSIFTAVITAAVLPRSQWIPHIHHRADHLIQSQCRFAHCHLPASLWSSGCCSWSWDIECAKSASLNPPALYVNIDTLELAGLPDWMTISSPVSQSACLFACVCICLPYYTAANARFDKTQEANLNTNPNASNAREATFNHKGSLCEGLWHFLDQGGPPLVFNQWKH